MVGKLLSDCTIVVAFELAPSDSDPLVHSQKIKLWKCLIACWQIYENMETISVRSRTVSRGKMFKMVTITYPHHPYFTHHNPYFHYHLLRSSSSEQRGKYSTSGSVPATASTRSSITSGIFSVGRQNGTLTYACMCRSRAWK